MEYKELNCCSCHPSLLSLWVVDINAMCSWSNPLFWNQVKTHLLQVRIFLQHCHGNSMWRMEVELELHTRRRVAQEVPLVLKQHATNESNNHNFRILMGVAHEGASKANCMFKLCTEKEVVPTCERASICDFICSSSLYPTQGATAASDFSFCSRCSETNLSCSLLKSPRMVYQWKQVYTYMCTCTSICPDCHMRSTVQVINRQYTIQEGSYNNYILCREICSQGENYHRLSFAIENFLPMKIKDSFFNRLHPFLVTSPAPNFPLPPMKMYSSGQNAKFWPLKIFPNMVYHT